MSRVYVDAPGGWMDVRYDATALPLIERAYNAVYPLHTGELESPCKKDPAHRQRPARRASQYARAHELPQG